MAFVSEKISEKDWDLFNSFRLKDTSLNKKVMILEKGKFGFLGEYHYVSNNFYWTIDKERDAYFILLGGQDRGQIDVFVLVWQEYKIYMNLEGYTNCDKKTNNVTIHRNITKLHIPEYLRKKETEVRELIKEAITSDIYRYAGNNVNVKIESIAEPCFLENPEEGI